MIFWLTALLAIIVIVTLIGRSANTDPLGGDGGSGCLSKGCFIRVGIIIVVVILTIAFYKFFSLF